MSNVLVDIFRLFSFATVEESTVEETLTEVSISVECNDLRIPSQVDFDAVISRINDRDSINISIIQNGTTRNYVQEDKECDFAQFAQDCSEIEERDEKKIIVSFTKAKINGIISIYAIGKFIEYLASLTCVGLLFKINETLGKENTLTFEIQNNNFEEFSTSTIKFIPQGRQRDIIHSNVDSLAKIKNLCHCPTVDKYSFVPEDFYPIVKNGSPLDDIFSRMSILYSAVFLFDIFNIEGNGIEYKLNGYRTIRQEINYSDIDLSSCEIYFQIYSWVYDGGNVVDKIGLARNILSLNFNKETLKLSETTFEAIKSSYKIYQKENIKQYIEIRNKISDQLIELRNKADKIVESFVGDYKKSFLAIVSFFASVVVIRVVSKGDFAGGFTIEVTLLSISFLLIFLVIMFFARWEINKQIGRYTEFYKNLKDRYRDLLDENDINRILNNDKDFIDNKQFIERRRKNYTVLWIVSLVILFVATVILFFINNLNLCQLIKCVLCCIASILQ